MSSLSAYVDDLLFENKLLRDQVAAFESGKKYQKLKEDYRRQLAEKDRIIKRLRLDLADARAQIKRTRDRWMNVNEDVVAEKEKAMQEAEKKVEKAEERAAEAERRESETRRKLHEKNEELYAVKAQLEEAQEKIMAQDAVIHRDYTNSSKPSSQSPDHKKIPNSRTKSGRPRGGQKGHIHYERKMLEPTSVIGIPVPEKYLDTSRYKPTGRIIRKQVQGIRIVVPVTEYQTPEFRDIVTGQRVHAEFPDRLKDDVTYESSVKAFAYILNNDLNVSIGKSGKFIKDITEGKINLSDGMICGLSEEFSKKTETERNEIFHTLVTAPYMNADFTFCRKDGKQATALICVFGDTILYQAKPKKGYEGVKDSPLAAYNGTVVSDHEAALIVQGNRHQECLSHVKRYAIGAQQNEPGKKWPGEMISWIGRSVGYWDEVDSGRPEDKNYAGQLKQEFKGILEHAKAEYEYEPPSDYYKDGYNLYSRMAEKPGDYLLFLDDPAVPPTNNAAERAARKFKRKAHQVMTFRSDEGVQYYCDGLSVMQTVKAENRNLYQAVKGYFDG